jgi:exopolysaccharide production protein ExoQ
MTTKAGLAIWERNWLLLGLLFFSGSLSLLYAPDTSEAVLRAEEKDYFSQVVNFLLYFFVVYLSLRNAQNVISVFLRNKIIFALLLLPFVSIFWSIEPWTTLTRSVFLFFTMMLAVSLYSVCSRDQFFKIIILFFLIVGILTLIAAVLSFGTAVHQDEHFPALRGFFRHKNITGRFFVLGVALSLYHYLLLRSGIALVTLVVSAVIVLLSLSGTALVLMASIFFVFLGFSVIKFDRNFSFIVLFLLFIILPVLIFYFIYSGLYLVFFEALGKDPTLTGRTTIWEVVLLDVFPNRPWFGYGYEGFWSSLEGAFWVEWGMYAYVPPHAHNVLLHTLVGLGGIGSVFLLFFVCKFIFQSCRSFLLLGDWFSIFCVALSVYMIVVNLTEVVIWKNNFIWFLIVYNYLELVDGKLSSTYE